MLRNSIYFCFPSLLAKGTKDENDDAKEDQQGEHHQVDSHTPPGCPVEEVLAELALEHVHLWGKETQNPEDWLQIRTPG